MEFGPKSNEIKTLPLVSPDVLRILPLAFLKQHQVFPIKVEGQKLFLAMVYPSDHTAIENARIVAGREIAPVPMSENIYLRSLGHYFSIVPDAQLFKDLDIDENLVAGNQGSKGVESQIIRVVNRLVEIAVEKRASDIHMEPQRNGFFVRIRIDGMLNTIHQFPLSIQSHLVSRIKIMAGLDISERRLPQDGQFSFTKGDEVVGVRVSSIPCEYGEKVVLRVLSRSVLQMDLRELQMPSNMKELLISLIERPYGLILLTGPTGSGKTTTLYAILKHLLSSYKNIITLEDPIEYELLAHTTRELGITQIQVNPKTGMTFATGLRSVLRQDPDVIMVGEIRDQETAEITMRAVMTGHLVLSTLHTSDAPSALNRLVEMGIERYLINSSVALVLAQQLVRLLCPKCKQPYNPPPELVKKIFPKDPGALAKIFYKSEGCPLCFQTGYFERRPIFELLAVDNEIRNQMEVDPSVEQLRKTIRRKGTKSLRDFGMDLVLEGLTTFDEVIRTTVEDYSSYHL